MSLSDLYAKYHESVEFLVIYIREAHPLDGWSLGTGIPGFILSISGSKAARDIYDPQTMEERRAVAGQCEDALRYGIHTLVDEMDDSVNKAYAAWPTRLYLVGRDSCIVYAGGLGPFGFRPSELGEAIRTYLSSPQDIPA